MTIPSLKSLIFIALAITGTMSTARALPMFCSSANYQDFINDTSDGPGFGCNIGGVEYFGAQFLTSVTGETPPTTPATASQINMSFSDNGFGLSGIPTVDNG